MVSEDLEPLRCPKGCDTRFLQYLVWEGTSMRILDTRRNWSKGKHETVYDIGLYCGDCGTQFGRKAVPHKSKAALDELLLSVAHCLQDLADQRDTDLLDELTGGTARLIEENGQ